MKIEISNNYYKDKQKIFSFLKKYTIALDKIFDTEMKMLKINLCLDKEKMEEKIGRNLSEWEVAVTKRDEIFILDPQKNNSEHYNKKIFWQVLLHETAYIYAIDKIFVNKKPLF